MKRFQKIYLEISNVCNLQCSFCPGTKRAKKVMNEEEFTEILPKLRDWTDYLYFHLMGEPLCHPHLEGFLELAGTHGFKVILTTNGTLLEKQKENLLHAPALHKVNISLHAFEANDLDVPFDVYLQRCFTFGKDAEGKKLVVYRLWNQGGADQRGQQQLWASCRGDPAPHCGAGLRDLSYRFAGESPFTHPIRSTLWRTRRNQRKKAVKLMKSSKEI